MSQDTLTIRGLLALWFAVCACFGYPMLLPNCFVQTGAQTWGIEPVPPWLWVLGVFLALVCVLGCVVAFVGGSRTDRVAGCAATLLTLVFIVALCLQMYSRRSPNQGAGANGGKRRSGACCNRAPLAALLAMAQLFRSADDKPSLWWQSRRPCPSLRGFMES
jgi:hypothetical protein